MDTVTASYPFDVHAPFQSLVPLFTLPLQHAQLLVQPFAFGFVLMQFVFEVADPVKRIDQLGIERRNLVGPWLSNALLGRTSRRENRPT
jgi:hypothetical protein